ncbi:hypothetical protein GGR22_000860 [Flavobacterium gossypii]|uniref:Bacteriophage abortive infection AbiH n=1 Tax=Flavobacterium gossypii TaxID=1646119 RepID=A0ABR6DMT3_9FLAO|nr:AbiH family protein [Flavobacterium gossypii]MBA9072734.1 hypothetical protein [Flavobacterium gossypii]
MNRLIIIGNGFDLAHELPTKYCDFINDYWDTVSSSNHSDEFINFSKSNFIFKKPISLSSILEHLKDSGAFNRASVKSANLGYFEHGNRMAINYKNRFFEILCEKFIETNWVDIEMEYYKQLKYIIGDADDINIENEVFQKVLKLNIEFKQLKDKFNEYLVRKVVPEVPNKKYQKMADILKPIIIYKNEAYADFLNEFPYKTVKEIEKEIRSTDALLDSALQGSAYRLKETFILNFNYTETISNYSNDLLDYDTVYIHGQAHNKINPINFGYGNEMDGKYELIENKNQNEYLKYMKSFAYSNNSGYRKFLNFIEKNKFQVHILGHSCGLSDRTLLNTIFEHENCVSIKVFYHKYKTADAHGNMDNYTDIVQNISRQFNKKKMMREKVVSRENSQCLPQIKD